MIRIPPGSTRTDTLLPDTTLVRAEDGGGHLAAVDRRAQRWAAVLRRARHREVEAGEGRWRRRVRAVPGGHDQPVEAPRVAEDVGDQLDRKSTRLNSSH